MTIQTALRKPPVLLAVATALIALAVLFRVQSLYPVVFSDEWSYSRMARWDSFSQAPIPSYLYFSVYRLTNLCGDGFLSCARLMNVVFFFSTIPFIYLVARRAVSPALAAWIALLVAVDPMNSYTGYFMPEAMFFFVFWLFAWSLLRLDTSHNTSDLIVPAVLFGLLSLIKPHSIFMYPAMVIYFGYTSRQTAYGAWLRDWATHSVVFVASSAFTKLAVGYAYAGKSGLTLIGGLYGNIASNASGAEKYLTIASNAIASLNGHLMILAMVYGTAVCALLYVTAVAVFQRSSNTAVPHRISVFGFLAIGSMVGLSAVFSAVIVGASPTESLVRVHMRYYNFALPFLLIVAGFQFSRLAHGNRFVLGALALVVAAVSGYAIATHIPDFAPSWVDAPEATAAADMPWNFYRVAPLGLLAALLWGINPRLGLWIFLFVFAPIMTVINVVAVDKSQQRFAKPDAFDRAGIVVSQMFPRSDRANIVLYGQYPGALTKVQFHIDSPRTKVVGTGPSSQPDLASIRNTNKIAVVFDPSTGAPAGVTELRAEGYSIFTADRPGLDLDFSQPVPSSGLASKSGLSLPEHWGAWSDAALVTLKFKTLLPDALSVHLRAQAFGPNIGKTFTMKVGKQAKDFSLSAAARDVELKFDNPGPSDTIAISVPQPASPHEIGMGGDTRKLGIGLINLRVE